MIIGIMDSRQAAGGGGGVPSTVPIYKGSMYTLGSFSVGSGTTLTYNGKDVGVAHAKRILVLATFVEETWANEILPKANGVDMALLGFHDGGNASDPDTVALWWIALPAGATVDISTFIRGARDFLAHYWIAYPNTAAPIEVGDMNWSEMGGPASVTITMSNLETQLNGFIICAAVGDAADNTAVWNETGTEVPNNHIDNAPGFTCSALMVTGTGASTTGDLSVTGGFNKAAVAASWGASP